MRSASRWTLYVGIGIALFFAAAWLNDKVFNVRLIARMASDFHEFYCAGSAVLQGADPYRVEPLATCMQRLEPNAEGWYATPAPLPGYALTMLAGFATLPFPVAQLLWETSLVACVLIASLALAELTGWPVLLMTLYLTPTVGLLNVIFGELTPIVVAALCLGALALERGHPRFATVCAGAAMIEPHIGLPALAALFILIPRARFWATGVAAALAIVSILTIGLAVNVEYFRSVLPLQAFAEVVANDQYSLTHFVALLGAAPSLALWLGSISYVAMGVVGIALTARLRRRRLAYVLLLPPAAVALGGSFIHDVQIATALPVALLVAADVRVLRKYAIFAAMLLIARISFSGVMAYVSITSLIAIAALGWTLLADKRPIWRASAVAMSFVVVGLAYVFLAAFPRPAAVHIAHESASILPAVTPDENASAAWAAYVRARPDMSTPSPRYLVEKVPAWAGLFIILWCAFSATGEPARAENRFPSRAEDSMLESQEYV